MESAGNLQSSFVLLGAGEEGSEEADAGSLSDEVVEAGGISSR